MVSAILEVVPDAVVEATDLHGSGDHFHVRVISKSYDGIRPLQRQKPILNHFKQYIASPKGFFVLKILCYALTLPQGLLCFPKIKPRKDDMHFQFFYVSLTTFIGFH